MKYLINRCTLYRCTIVYPYQLHQRSIHTTIPQLHNQLPSQPVFNYAYNATIIQLNLATPTVKHIRLYINSIAADDIDNIQYNKLVQLQRVPPISQNFQFQSGQWVDLHIPNIYRVGGYTITSIPSDYMKYNTIDLYIKYSQHPVVNYIHNHAEINDPVKIRVGGTFIYGSDINDPTHQFNTIFCAGGVGVNTVYSMLCVRMNVLSQLYRKNIDDMPNTTFLYTAKSMSELLFHHELCQLQKQYNNKLIYEYSLTGDGNDDNTNANTNKRITLQQIERYITQPISSNRIYMCGPSQMCDELNDQLLTVDELQQSQVLYEKWW